MIYASAKWESYSASNSRATLPRSRTGRWFYSKSFFYESVSRCAGYEVSASFDRMRSFVHIDALEHAASPGSQQQGE